MFKLYKIKDLLIEVKRGYDDTLSEQKKIEDKINFLVGYFIAYVASYIFLFLKFLPNITQEKELLFCVIYLIPAIYIYFGFIKILSTYKYIGKYKILNGTLGITTKFNNNSYIKSLNMLISNYNECVTHNNTINLERQKNISKAKEVLYVSFKYILPILLLLSIIIIN